jgi:hypothetical protein
LLKPLLIQQQLLLLMWLSSPPLKLVPQPRALVMLELIEGLRLVRLLLHRWVFRGVGENPYGGGGWKNGGGGWYGGGG